MAKNYLVAGFHKTTKEAFDDFFKSHPHDRRCVSDTSLLEDVHANVANASDVTLTPHDEVRIDGFGRVNGFIHRGKHYVVAYS